MNTQMIVTIMEFKGLRPYAVRTLKQNEKYSQDYGRYKTEEAAISAVKELEALGATAVTPYRFQKIVSAY